MRILLLLTLGLGLAWASPLGKMKPLPEVDFTDPESGVVKAKLNKLHELLAELSSQVGDAKIKVKNEVARDLKTSGKLEDPFFKDLDPSDVAILKGMRDRLAKAKNDVARNTLETSGSLGEPDFVDVDPNGGAVHKGMRTYLQGLKNKLAEQQKVAQKREQTKTVIPDDVKDLLEKYKSRVKYLRAALEDEKVNSGKPNPDDVPKQNLAVDGAFGQFDDDKNRKEEWKEQALTDDLLGAKTVGTKFVDPDGKSKIKTLNAVEKRLLDDLKYARDNGVDVRQILHDLQEKKGN